MKEPSINRKEFIISLGLGSAALTLIGLSGESCSGGKRSPVEVSRNGFIVDGKLFPVYSGSFHYWCHKYDLWPALFDRLSRMGLNTICTSIPWGVHEIERGKFDFGSHDKRKDLASFIDLAEKKGFKVLVRPGPHFDSESACSSLPQRVLYDIQVAARTSEDTFEIHHTPSGQFPVPSCFSEKSYKETALYFDAVIPILASRLHTTGGPVIGVQADSGMSYFGHMRYPYTLDYHPRALVLYRERLARKYVRVEGLNRAYGTHYQSFEMVEPPRRFRAERMDNLPAYLDWVEFREWGITWSVERIARMMAERGIMGVPVFYCIPEDFRAPANIVDTEATQGIDLVGISSNTGSIDYDRERELCRAGAGMSAYPFRPEYGAGFCLSGQRISQSPENMYFASLTALMHGLKGWNIYMAVERDRWIGSPIRRDGRPRKELYGVYRQIYRFLRESRLHEFSSCAQIIFLFNHSLDRLVHAMEQTKVKANFQIDGGVFAESIDFGFRSSPEACHLWSDQVQALMREVGFEWNYGSTRLPATRLLEYRVAVLPTIDFLYAEELAALEQYVHAGGTLIFGPERCRLDEGMKTDWSIMQFFNRAVSVGDYLTDLSPGDRSTGGNLIYMESPLQVGDLLKTLEIEIPFTRSNSSLDLAVQCSRDNRKMLFVANPSAKQQNSDIFFAGSHGFRNLWTGASFESEGKIRVRLPAYRVEVWEVS